MKSSVLLFFSRLNNSVRSSIGSIKRREVTYRLKVKHAFIYIYIQIWVCVCVCVCVCVSGPPLWSSGQSSRLYNGDVLWFLWGTNWIYICYAEESRPPLWSSGQSSWLQIQRSWVRFAALSDFLRRSGSGTESTQRREYNRSYSEEK
jgi:hypothetical protein